MLLLCHYINFLNVCSLIIPPMNLILEKSREYYIILTHEGGIKFDKTEENSYALSLPLLTI